MKILKQDRKGNQVTIEVEEDYSSLGPRIEKAYTEVSMEVKIPGFRQGKIPKAVLQKYINEEAVLDRAVQMLISEIYPDIVDRSSIKPVDYPNVEVKKFEKGSPCLFIIKVDVYPEFKISGYKGITLKKMSSLVSDAEVDNTLDYIRKSYAKQSNLNESDLPLDDEFAKKVSAVGTLAELKAMLKTNIEEEKKRDVEQGLRDEASRKLSDIIEVDVPKGMVEHEIENMMHDLETTLKKNRMTIKSYLSAMKKDIEQMKEEMKPSALIRIKSKLALEAISEKEKLDIEQKDLDKELEVIAQHSGKDLEEYKKEISVNVIESLKEYMLKEKAMELVISKAKIEEESAKS